MSDQLITQLCMTFDSMYDNNNQLRNQAEGYLQQIQSCEGLVQSLLYIATSPQEVNKGRSGDISAQAAFFLKNKINQCWGNDQGQENIDINKQQNLTYGSPLAQNDKQYLRENIFKALDSCPSKTVQSAVCHIIYNIAEVDFPENWQGSIPEISSRLSAGDEQIVISGLLALRNVLQALEYDEEPQVLNQYVELFFPLLEQIMTNVAQSNSANQILIMHLISKIFFSANNLQISGYFVQQPQRISPWMSFFQSVLETPLGDLEAPTESSQQMEQLEQQLPWKLKGIVAQITNRLFAKYGTGISATEGNVVLLKQFSKYFEMNHVVPLLQCHLKIILSKKSNFVGNKTLCASLKTVQIGLKFKQTRQMISEHINAILFEISLPLMLLTQSEYDLWNDNPVEFVRKQADQSDHLDVKQIIKLLTRTICGIKQTRRQKVSDYLQNFLQVLASNLSGEHQDFRVKEAILHSLGNMKDLISSSVDLQQSIEPLLQQFVFSELTSENGFMRARACWVYGQFGEFPYNNQDHLHQVLNSIYQNLSHPELPVRVEAAVALHKMLGHQEAVDFLRPGLEVLLKTYLKIMDDIEYDELVSALKQLVQVYEDEIAPYAVGLCQKLSDAFIRLVHTKGVGEEEDQETCLTSVGVMTAIRRVLQSISGQYKDLYPQLEEILDKAIELCFTEMGSSSTEEGIACLSELLYNQDQVSPRLWKFYLTIIDLYVNNKGLLDEYLVQFSVPLVNYMAKDPEQFRNAVFDGYGSCVDMMFTLITRIFEVARIKEDEIEALVAVSLLNSLMENVTGLDSQLHCILEYFVKELSIAKTCDYKCMLSQGICMCLWYNTSQTLMSLESLGCTSQFFDLIFSQVETLKQDFEIKRFVLGLSSLIQKDQSELPPSVQPKLATIIKALVFLCQKSIVIRVKNKQKEEQAEEDNVEQNIIEDEDNECDILSDEDSDEDYDCQEDFDRDLYDSKLDQMDEVLFFRDIFTNLEHQNTNMYNFYLSCLDMNEQQNFQQAIQKAMEFQQAEMAQQQNPTS